MNRKVLLTIFVLGIAALALLAIRQEQINTVNSMSVMHNEIDDIDAELDTIKIKIEVASSPQLLDELLETAYVQQVSP